MEKEEMVKYLIGWELGMNESGDIILFDGRGGGSCLCVPLRELKEEVSTSEEAERLIRGLLKIKEEVEEALFELIHG